MKLPLNQYLIKTRVHYTLYNPRVAQQGGREWYHSQRKIIPETLFRRILRRRTNTMPYHIRPLDTTIDLPRIVELVNLANPEPISEEAFRARHEQEVPGRVSYTAVVVDETGAIGGYVS